MSWFKTDNAGRTPEPGDYVAYNYSGQIATGFIKTKSRDGVRFTIEQVLPHEGHISRIRGGAKTLLVLDVNGTPPA